MNNIPYKHLNVLLMPTDYCNMNCKYCFDYRKVSDQSHVMTEDILRKIYEITIPNYQYIHFIWHGGEPLSLGLAFYQEAISMQKDYNKSNTEIVNSVQSNLSLLDDEMVDFFNDSNIHIGGSFDGINNEATRHNTDAILEGCKKIKKSGKIPGLIYVVQSLNVNRLIEDYSWFKSRGYNYTLNLYIPQSNRSDELAVDSEYMVGKLCDFFDYWVHDSECNIHLGYYDTILKYLFHKTKELCTYTSCMGRYIGVFYNGDIYNCNRDFPDKFCFGNVMDYYDIHECFESEGFNALLKASVMRRKRCMESCEIYDFCRGGCNSAAFMNGDVKTPNFYLCDVQRRVYEYLKQWVEKTDFHSSHSINPYVKKMLERNEK